MDQKASVPGRVALFHGWAESPLWYRTPGDLGPVDLTGLPISPELRERLLAWNEFADVTMSANGYEWPSTSVEAEFLAQGSILAEALREELGIEVEYRRDADSGGR
ncbi:hypothetical protein [Actinotalea sp. C106]|uniref:hypothetical protein n=1 Tax=Actinotalea sp. C106 TaxID=2908644 RepID=UPI00202991C6|nr:hypothetical protein [Actinotalea sp. C106]